MSNHAPVSVSVIIPTYKHRDFILETLDSVFAQTFTDYEVIVVNDGSPDNTAEILKPLIEAGKIRYIEQANGGQASARNRGIAEAQGEHIALLDDDDLWPANKLEWQVNMMRSLTKTGIIAGSAVYFNNKIPELILRDNELVSCLTFESLFSGNVITSPGQTLIRRAVLEEVGGFSSEIWGTDDYDLWLRASRITRIELYNSEALFYRLHGLNASLNFDRMLENGKKTINSNLSAADASARDALKKAAYRQLYGNYGSQMAERINADIRKKHFRGFLSDFLWVVHMIIELRHDRKTRNLLVGKLIK